MGRLSAARRGGGVLRTSDYNNQQCAKGKERLGEQVGAVCFSEGVRWENSGPFESGEEGINQDGETESMGRNSLGGQKCQTGKRGEQVRLVPLLAVHTVGAQQIYGTKTLSEEAPVSKKPSPSLGEAVQGWASSLDIIKFILPVKPQTEQGWARGAQQV